MKVKPSGKEPLAPIYSGAFNGKSGISNAVGTNTKVSDIAEQTSLAENYIPEAKNNTKHVPVDNATFMIPSGSFPKRKVLQEGNKHKMIPFMQSFRS